MAETLKEIEERPLAYPDLQNMQTGLWMGNGLTGKTIWQRIEAYTAHRWMPRTVVWTVEGPGAWEPAADPCDDHQHRKMAVGGMDKREPATVTARRVRPRRGACRITATVGEVPEAVHQAFRRLAEYMAAAQDTAGAAKVYRQEGDLSLSVEHRPAWLARAMQYSGAGDLLRPYRRA